MQYDRHPDAAERLLQRVLALHPSPRDCYWSSWEPLERPETVLTGLRSPGRGDAQLLLTAFGVPGESLRLECNPVVAPSEEIDGHCSPALARRRQGKDQVGHREVSTVPRLLGADLQTALGAPWCGWQGSAANDRKEAYEQRRQKATKKDPQA
jgi:hypothetical protein